MKDIEIKEIPLLNDYVDIRNAIIQGELIIFIGAGVSKICGCHNWKKLAQSLIDECYNLKLIDYREKTTFYNIKDYKKTISICKSILEEKNYLKNFFETVKKSIDSRNTDEFKHYGEIYSKLRDLLFGMLDITEGKAIDDLKLKYENNQEKNEDIKRGFFITTNFDPYLSEYFDIDNEVIKQHNDIPENYNDYYKKKLYHLHGYFDIEQNRHYNIILTAEDYIEVYNNENVMNFLRKVFNSDRYNVLFIGYGLGEFEILDYLVSKSGYDPNNSYKKHFILLPYWSNENKIVKYEKPYYNSLNINTIPYSKDNGYEQLVEIIKKWNEEISKSWKEKLKTSKSLKSFSDGTKEIDDLFEDK